MMGSEMQSSGRVLRGHEQRLASGITVRKEDKTWKLTFGPGNSVDWRQGNEERRITGRPPRQQVQYGLQRHGAMQNQAFPGNIPESHAGIPERWNQEQCGPVSAMQPPNRI
jgi:hypothetical protein